MKPPKRASMSFGRHETFALRFGWITKGYKALCKDENIFESDEATIALGVGKNMVHAIRYWMVATKMIKVEGGSLIQTPLGRCIFDAENGYDPYLEDDATIWLLHWLIASNASDATAFFWFFNRFHKPEFTQKELFDALRDFVSENSHVKASSNTLKSDITLMLRMYEPSIESKSVPAEEGLDSPLSLLGLIREIGDTKYHESRLENKWNLPIAPFCYAVIETLEASQLSSLPIERLMTSDGAHAAPGAVYRLSDEGLISKLEEMVSWLPGYFELRETAGIHELYKLKQIDPEDVLTHYYGNYQRSCLERAA